MATDKTNKTDNRKENLRGDTMFHTTEFDASQDEETKRALARIAEIEERNEKMERIKLDEEKVIGADVERSVKDGIQVKTYSVSSGAHSVYNIMTESEIEKEVAEFQRRQQEDEDEMFEQAFGHTAVDAKQAAESVRIDPEEIAAKMKLITKDDRIICIGDSITYGYEVDGSQTWIGRLRREDEINLLNVGLNGDTCENMLMRFKEHVLDLTPKAVLIMGGGNDILSGTPLEYVTNNVAMMSQMALNKGIVPMVGISPEPSPKDVPEEWHQMVDYNVVREKLATYKEWLITFAKANLMPYIDFDSGMKNKLRAGYGRYFLDGIHPNPAGHKIMAAIARHAFQEMGILKKQQDDRFEL